MIKGVRDKKMIRLVDDNSKWVTQTRVQGWTSIPSVSSHPLSGQSVKPSGRTIPSPDEVIVRIRNIKVALRIKGDTRWA
jgi:hypothetical protein